MTDKTKKEFIFPEFKPFIKYSSAVKFISGALLFSYSKIDSRIKLKADVK